MNADAMALEEATATDGGVRAKRLALIVSKGTLDQAYPPLVMATTAASMGWEVGVFFTFYGIDVIHKKRMPKLSVSPVGNPAMPPPVARVPVRVPSAVGVLPGMKSAATAMMKGWLTKSGLAPVPELLDIARQFGVRLFACNTSLGVMGVGADDLIDGVEFAGAPTFLDYAGDADVQLFI